MGETFTTNGISYSDPDAELMVISPVCHRCNEAKPVGGIGGLSVCRVIGP